MVKEFGERQHRMSLDNWIIPFAAYTTAETPNAIQRAGTTEKTVFPQRNVDFHLIQSSLGPNESAYTQTASWSVQPFLQD